MEKIKCPICGTLIEDEEYEPCPYCSWAYVGIEGMLDPNEKEAFNLMSINQAKALFKAGKNKWGKPLKSK